MTITRCPSSTASSSSTFLTRIPASTTITPAQFYSSKDSSLPSSLSIYPKSSQASNAARSIIQSSVSPVIASPTRASPQAGYAKQPASPMPITPAILDELLLNKNFSGLAPEVLKETLRTYNSMYAKVAQQHLMAGNSQSHSQSFPVRNKSVITTSRASAMDVIDLSASNSPTPSRSMSAVAALQLQQQAQAASTANKRAHNGQYMNGNQSTRSMQSSSSTSASTRLQQQMQMAAGMNGYGVSAYKIEKSFIENQMVHCINIIPYQPNSDMVIPLSELRDQFYPNANLDVCKRVMQALDINLYSGTK